MRDEEKRSEGIGEEEGVREEVPGEGGSGGGRRWLVTERDMEWLGWLGRWRFATAAQVSVHFEQLGQSAPVRVVERRMRAARELGLVESQRVLHEVSSVHWLTRDGMSLVGVTGSVFEPKLAQFSHDLAVTDLAAWWLRYRPEWRIVTERELRRGSGKSGEPAPENAWAVTLPEFGVSNRRVYPDLIVIDPQERVYALEMEFSRKDGRRLQRLMGTYASHPAFTGAFYYAVASIREYVESGAQAANAVSVERGRGKRIRVEPWPLAPTDIDDISPVLGQHHTSVGKGEGWVQ